MKVSWREHFRTSNLFPSHSKPKIFIISQWQLDKQTPSIFYSFIRVAIFTTFFVVWILGYTLDTAMGKSRWPIFLTNWGMTICVLQSFLSCLMVTCAVIGQKAHKPRLLEIGLKIQKPYWVVNVMATTVAFTITIVYWSVIYTASGYQWSTINFMVHGFNSILMFADLCLVSHPVRLLHFIYPVGFTLVYTIMTVIFYLCGGTSKDGSRYIYPILKWDEPGTTCGYCFAVLILIIIIHTFTFFVYKTRVRIAELWFKDSDKQSKNSIYDSSIQIVMNSNLSVFEEVH